MKWKEFLKPDWTKLLVFILLVPVLSFIQSFFWLPQQENPIIFSVFSVIISPFLDLLLPFLPTGQITGPPLAYLIPYNFFFFVIGIIDSIYTYFLASLIVFAYRKIRK